MDRNGISINGALELMLGIQFSRELGISQRMDNSKIQVDERGVPIKILQATRPRNPGTQIMRYLEPILRWKTCYITVFDREMIHQDENLKIERLMKTSFQYVLDSYPKIERTHWEGVNMLGGRVIVLSTRAKSTDSPRNFTLNEESISLLGSFEHLRFLDLRGAKVENLINFSSSLSQLVKLNLLLGEQRELEEFMDHLPFISNLKECWLQTKGFFSFFLCFYLLS